MRPSRVGLKYVRSISLLSQKDITHHTDFSWKKINAARRQADGRHGTFAHYNANMINVPINREGENAITLQYGLALVVSFDTSYTRTRSRSRSLYTRLWNRTQSWSLCHVRVLRFGRSSDRIRDKELSFLRMVSFATYPDDRRRAKINITVPAIQFTTCRSQNHLWISS